MPGGQIILLCARYGVARRFDARTGEVIGDADWRWDDGTFCMYGSAVAPVPDGRVILTGAGDKGIARIDVISGAAYPPTAGEQPDTIWDVATATLPGGRVLIAGAGQSRQVFRWDAATGEPVG
jgi:hypothetical protein